MKSLAATEATDYSLRKATKKNKKPQSVPPLRLPNSKWVRSSKDKAELFAEYLAKVSHAIHTRSHGKRRGRNSSLPGNTLTNGNAYQEN